MAESRVKQFCDYARYYDLTYRDKDYDGECDFLEHVFEEFSTRPVKSILDVGCGTGQHAMALAGRGHVVTGIDVSERAIKVARGKFRKQHCRAQFVVADMRSFYLKTRFDACICMFAAIGYLPETRDIQAALARIRGHLSEGSLFVFDCWNGLAVLRTLPSVRVRTMHDGLRDIVRVAEPELDAFHHLCRIKYQLIVSEGNTIVDRIEETHVMRFLFPQEILHYLDEAGFRVLHMCSFPDVKQRVDENAWNIAVVAVAKGL